MDIYAIDLLNHGKSPIAKDFDLAIMADKIFELMDKLKINKVNLLGHSLGGKIAMLMALFNPAKIESLIIEDIAPVDYNGSESHNEFMKIVYII